jgi:V/A-type H+-transporting ATPase subunit I
MILRMAKIAVMGPRELLLPTLAFIEQQGVLQVDQEIRPQQFEAVELSLPSIAFDRDALRQRFVYEDLLMKIDELLTCLSPEEGREYSLDTDSLANFVMEIIDKHILNTHKLDQEAKNIAHTLKEYQEAWSFLDAVSPLFKGKTTEPLLDYIGISIRNPGALKELQEHLQLETGKPIVIDTVEREGGELSGIIAAERETADFIRKKLHHNLVLERDLPRELLGLSMPEQIAVLTEKRAGLLKRQGQINEQLALFSQRWQGVYRQVRNWIVVQLSLLKVTASVYQTSMCFFIFGWIPQKKVESFREGLDAEFSGKVTVEEKEILVQELERVPTILYNSTYFKPFEIFSRLLPLPDYSSFDLTPFIGIFFPLFFGMMLGDMGYGLIVSCLGLILLYSGRKKLARDAGKIMVVCGLYTIIFGLLYGEFLGGLGAQTIGLTPILLDRHETILPSLYFSLGVGIIHISIALLLGGLSARRRGETREALFQFVSIAFIFFLSLLVAASLFPVSQVFRTPMLIGGSLLLLLLFLIGGFLAPLEVLKHLGNIISYARIMAIGLTSVLLAHVANHLAGMTGSIWLGIMVGLLLHGFNLLLGIFAPTIHGLRLHFVEFFSKTMEKRGREFTPLGRKNHGV